MKLLQLCFTPIFNNCPFCTSLKYLPHLYLYALQQSKVRPEARVHETQ